MDFYIVSCKIAKVIYYLQGVFVDCFDILFLFICYCFLGPHLRHMEVRTLGRGGIRAAAASLPHSHSNTGSEQHLQPTPQLMAMPDP